MNYKKRIKKILVKFHYREFKHLPTPPKSDGEHLQATMAWLCLAQDVTNCGGVSSFFDLSKRKWGKPYRETTGYIINTFIDYYFLTGKKEYFKRAEKMGQWEISVQCKDGSFGEIKEDGTVGKKIFNTGQIILGLLNLFQLTQKHIYIDAAEKAASWLITNQEVEGNWEKFTSKGSKTYHIRVTWPLLELYKITNNNKYLESAQKNINWVLKQQQQNYWFKNTSLSKTNEPWTHLIAYTLRGLLECYVLLNKSNEEIFKAFYQASNTILDYYQKNKKSYLPCSFNEKWEPKGNYSCLTGNAQLAIVWMKIYELTKEKKFLDGAFEMIEQIKTTQVVDSRHKEIKGGILGSYPLEGEYGQFLILNWATKFFADALILKEKITKIHLG